MKIKRLFTIVFGLSLVALLMLPPLMWVLSLTGLPVRSLFSDAGLRWLFLYGADVMFSRATCITFYAIVTYGVMRYVRLDGTPLRHWPFFFSLLLAAVFDALLLLAVFHPQSPLVSLSGHLVPSPFLHGFPYALCVGLILVALFYGLLVRRITGVISLVGALSFGLRRHVPLLLLVMFISYLYSAIRWSLSL